MIMLLGRQIACAASTDEKTPKENMLNGKTAVEPGASERHYAETTTAIKPFIINLR